MRFVLLAGCLALAVTSPALARPCKAALAHYFGSRLAKKLNDCRTCHLPERRGPAEGRGRPGKAAQRLRRATREGEAVTSRGRQSATIDACLDAILYEDSDGDGASNLLELLAGRFPGDPEDRPNAAELTEPDPAGRVLREKKGYPWRPFEAVHRPAVPTVQNAGWVQNPIDAFIAVEHEAFGLTPRPEAARAVLAAPLYLDLIGLPPTPAELHAFLKDASPQAYEKVVESCSRQPAVRQALGPALDGRLGASTATRPGTAQVRRIASVFGSASTIAARTIISTWYAAMRSITACRSRPRRSTRTRSNGRAVAAAGRGASPGSSYRISRVGWESRFSLWSFRRKPKSSYRLLTED